MIYVITKLVSEFKMPRNATAWQEVQQELLRKKSKQTSLPLVKNEKKQWSTLPAFKLAV